MDKGFNIVIGILIVFIIIFAVFVVFIVQELNQEKALIAELELIDNLFVQDELNFDELNSRLERRVTTKSYLVVETAAKEYLSNIVKSLEKLDKLSKDESISVLSIDNIKSDGPNFKKSKKILSDAHKVLEEIKLETDEYFSKDKAMSYIKDKNLENYYILIYEDYILDKNSANTDKTKKEIEDNLNSFKNLLNKEEEIINLLHKNKNSWKIEDNTIIFNSKSLSEQYNNLVKQLEKE